MKLLVSAPLLFGFWVLLVGTGDWLELLAGGCAASLAAAAQAVARRRSGRHTLVGLREAARAAPVLWRALVELGLVLGSLRSGRPHGAFRRLAVPVRGRGAPRTGLRALATLVGTFPPNTIVVDVDPETGDALVHDLDPRRARAELP
jgi:hypothetical protein